MHRTALFNLGASAVAFAVLAAAACFAIDSAGPKHGLSPHARPESSRPGVENPRRSVYRLGLRPDGSPVVEQGTDVNGVGFPISAWGRPDPTQTRDETALQAPPPEESE